MIGPLLVGLYVFVLAIFVGFEIITKIPPTLHTPLMSGANAISGITLVGAIYAARMGEFVEMCKSRALRPGFDEILVPGEQEARRVKAKSASGVPLDDVVLADLQALGRELGLKATLDPLGPYTGATL